MIETILFIVFVILTIIGSLSIWKSTGNHDLDYFLKIIGWMLLIPGIFGILESIKFL